MRNAKPLEILLAEGNTRHLTKAEIEHRKTNQMVSLGDQKFKMPTALRNTPVARLKWVELMRIFRGTTHISTSDTGFLAQLCLAYAELHELINTLHELEQSNIDRNQARAALGSLGDAATNAIMRKIEQCVSVAGIVTLHKAIDAKRKYIAAAEDRLFLNPLAKLRNVPKPAVEKKEDIALKNSGFGNV